jgi:hypothetical protein
MRLVNLTPHALTLRLPTGEDHVLAPSGQIARVVSPDAGAPRQIVAVTCLVAAPGGAR